MKDHRIDQFLQRLFWTALISISGFLLRETTELNQKMAVVVEKLSVKDKEFERLDTRVRILEEKVH